MIITSWRRPKLNLFGAVASTAAALFGAATAHGAEPSPAAARAGAGVPVVKAWTSSGQNNQNTRYAAGEHIINAGNVGTLKPKWTFTTAGNVSATATVVNGIAYVPDWGGKLWAIDTKTGVAIWSHNVGSE